MTILHVVASMNPEAGGVCQAVRTLVGGLTARGVASEVACLDNPHAAFLAEGPFPTHALGPARTPWQHAPALLPWLLQHLPRFDAVVVHGLWLYHGHAVRIARARLATAQSATALPRLLLMPHGMLDPYFQRAAGRRLKALRNRLYWQLVERHVVNQADGLLFTCEEERRLAERPFRPYAPRHAAVVGLGVATPPPYTPAHQAAFRQKCPALRNAPYYLYLGRIHEKKGVDLLIEAFASARVPETTLPGEPPASPPALVVAGPGLDTPYGRHVRALAARAGENILFPGMLTGEARWGAFYGCAAFVLPSHQENFGLAVVEALACGKPTLISNQVNLWREIAAAGAGLVSDDTAEGTRALLQQWQDLPEAEQQRMGQAARQCYATHFDPAFAAQRLIRVIEEV